MRNSQWAQERYLNRLSNHSLSLLALERPNDPLVHRTFAGRLLADHSVPQSIEEFQKACQLDPKDYPSHFGLGMAFMEAGFPQDAERAFVRAAELRPKDSAPHFKLAELYSRYRNSTSAIPPLERVVELDPKNAEAWYRLGLAYGDLHQWDRSLQALTTAVQLNPRRPTYQRDLGQVQAHFGQTEQALVSLQRARDIDPSDPGTLVLLANTAMRRGSGAANLKEAEEYLRDALRLDNGYAPALRELGTLKVRQRDLPAAISALRRAAELDPSDGEALFQLGQALIRSGKKEEGTRILAGFHALSEARRQVSMLEDRIHQDPKNPDLRLRLAKLYRKYGREDRAVNQYQVYLTFKPSDAGVRRELEQYIKQLRRDAGSGPQAGG